MIETHPNSYFQRVDDQRYVPTTHAGGAWSDDDLHVSPVVGLIVHHLEQWRRAHSLDGKILGRLSLDILGRLTRGDIELESRLLRPGATIELVETTVTIAGRQTLLARAWFTSSVDTSVIAEGEWHALPSPHTAEPYVLTDIWRGGYIRSVEARRVGTVRPGRATAWVRSRVTLVAEESVSDLAAFVALVDTANGVAVRQSPDEWMFPNLDLTMHFFRQPAAGWVGFDTTVAFGPDGQGLTSTILHDERGPVGSAQQILTVRRQP